MRTLHSVTLITSLLFLISCNKKNKILNALKTTAASDTVQISPEEINVANLAGYFAQNLQQRFTISPKNVTVVKGKKGLKVTVDPADLESLNGGKVDDKIVVTLIELTNVNDLFRSNVATTSDGRLLVSGGSYFVGMESGGQPLRLKPGRTITMDFPHITKGEMELFYGQKDQNGSMNWEVAGQKLELQREEISFTDSNRYAMKPFQEYAESLVETDRGKVFKSMDEEVYYYGKKSTLQQVVDTINRCEQKVFIERISFWPKDLPTDRVLDTNHLISLYGQRFLFILRTYQSIKHETAARERKQRYLDSLKASVKPTLGDQIQKYYAPAELNSLGCINCDRFYNGGETNVETELPITLLNSRIQYFVICKNFRGMLNGFDDFNENSSFVMNNLLVGEPVKIVAFAKNKGILYQAEHNFVVQRNQKPTIEFNVVTPERLSEIFGNNIKL